MTRDNSPEEGLVVLTNQSFRDAGGKDEFSILKIVGPVHATSYHDKGLDESMRSADAELRKSASDLGMSHVFKIEYKTFGMGHPGNNIYGCEATGTGYKTL